MLQFRQQFALLAAVALATGVSASAQPRADSAARAGDLVLVRVVGPADGPVGLRCEARVTAVRADTLVLARDGRCPLGSYAGDVAVRRGDRGSRGTHALIGLVGGAVVGGVAGRIIVGDGCRVSPCDGGLAVLGYAVIGAGLGALGGAVAGALLPAGPRWAAAGAGQPLRVAGLAVQPGVGVSLGPRPR